MTANNEVDSFFKKSDLTYDLNLIKIKTKEMAEYTIKMLFFFKFAFNLEQVDSKKLRRKKKGEKNT